MAGPSSGPRRAKRGAAAVVVRDAAPGDIPDLADIPVRATRAACVFMARTHSDEDFAEFVRASFDERDAARVAETAGRNVGFHCLSGDVVDRPFVAPEFQRRGVGSVLLRDAMALGPSGFTLLAFRANRTARAFYERRGLAAVVFGVSEDEKEPDATCRWRPDDRSRRRETPARQERARARRPGRRS